MIWITGADYLLDCFLRGQIGIGDQVAHSFFASLEATLPGFQFVAAGASSRFTGFEQGVLDFVGHEVSCIKNVISVWTNHRVLERAGRRLVKCRCDAQFVREQRRDLAVESRVFKCPVPRRTFYKVCGDWRKLLTIRINGDVRRWRKYLQLFQYKLWTRHSKWVSSLMEQVSRPCLPGQNPR